LVAFSFVPHFHSWNNDAFSSYIINAQIENVSKMTTNILSELNSCTLVMSNEKAHVGETQVLFGELSSPSFRINRPQKRQPSSTNLSEVLFSETMLIDNRD
jgi:hypothetical protein